MYMEMPNIPIQLIRWSAEIRKRPQTKEQHALESLMLNDRLDRRSDTGVRITLHCMHAPSPHIKGKAVKPNQQILNTVLVAHVDFLLPLGVRSSNEALQSWRRCIRTLSSPSSDENEQVDASSLLKSKTWAGGKDVCSIRDTCVLAIPETCEKLPHEKRSHSYHTAKSTMLDADQSNRAPRLDSPDAKGCS